MVYELVPAPPWMCDLPASARAVPVLARGAMPQAPPRGCVHVYSNPNLWNDYCAVLGYLRQATGERTFVANVLNRYPYESINGPAGRLSPFRAEAGICWLSWIKVDLDAEFAQALLDSTDTVVVWEPRQQLVDPVMRLERVVAVIREYFESEARFGDIEVWRRKAIDNGQLVGSHE